MVKSASTLRKEGRTALKGHWGIAIIVMILALLLGGLGTFMVNGDSSVKYSYSYTDPSGVLHSQQEEITTEEALTEMFGAATAQSILSVLSVVALIQFIIGGATELGYKKFNIDLVEGNGAKVGTLFSRYRIFFKALWLRILMVIKIFLWTLLLIIPGIIASYRYAMAPYLMAENPELSAGEAIKLSKRMMKGYKGRLFCLQLSFIGWVLLGLITCGIAFIWIEPYIQAAYAAFFKMVSENYAGETAVATEIPVQVTE